MVSILSMQRVLNYGSFLQAYALKQLLLEHGAEQVYFMDIQSGKPLPGYSLKKSSSLFRRIWRILKIVFIGKLFCRLRDKSFKKRVNESISACFPMLGLDEKPLKTPDIVVIGSDEVFNCCQLSPWGYTLQLYGKIPAVKRIISYAASFGHTTLEQLKKFHIDTEIGDALKTLSAISVRDENSYHIVYELTGVNPQIHLDPVLIYGFQKEIEGMALPKVKDYIVIYSYQGRIKDRSEIQRICNFAKKENKKLLSIFCRYDWCDEAIIPNTPLEVLAWFKGADYVITDTFHGTIFSIITYKQFGTLIRLTNVQKLTSLLCDLNLSDRCISAEKDMDVILKSPINYCVVEDILRKEREKALKFLCENIYCS